MRNARCLVCTNPNVDDIDLLLHNEIPLRELEKKYGVGRSTLHKHKREHIERRDILEAREAGLKKREQELLRDRTEGKTDLKNSDEIGRWLNKNWFFSVLKKTFDQMDRLMDVLEREKKWYALNQNVANLIKLLTQLGEYLGLWDNDKRVSIELQTQRNEVIVSQFDIVMEVLSNYPEAKQAVIARLLESQGVYTVNTKVEVKND